MAEGILNKLLAGGRGLVLRIASAAIACACATVLLALLLLPGMAYAAPKGSITLDCTVERDHVEVPLAGDRYAAILVASADADSDGVRYEVLDAFASADCGWADLDAGQLREKAHQIYGLASDASMAPAATLAINSSGLGAAWGLDPGIYLVYRIEAAPANADTTVDPFLVGVPTLAEGTLTYDVVAYPKFGIEGDAPGDGNSSGPGGFPLIDLPTTGDIQMALVGMLALLGAGMVAASRRITR